MRDVQRLKTTYDKENPRSNNLLNTFDFGFFLKYSKYCVHVVLPKVQKAKFA